MAHHDPNTLPDVLPEFSRPEFEDTCKRRFIYGLGFDSYGGVAGLYDFGPVGCAVKSHFINQWRQHFIIEEGMLEIDTSSLTPEEVFKTSGHTQRFTDVMMQDAVTGDLFRTDKYLEEWTDKQLTDPKISKKLSDEQKAELKDLHNKADGMSIDEFKEHMKKWDVKSPKGNGFTEPKDFNLMFPTPIGPAGDRTGYLRPELAQGIILNFNRLLEFNGGRMPLAGACIGQAYRNEIAPRNNLLRVREFTLAEIEHFVNPNDKSCPKFATVKHLDVWMWTKEDQETGKDARIINLGKAVEDGTINNETLGYFIGRVVLFLRSVGIKYVRYRQHRSNEMAHYAQDCWDAEVLSSFGWVECVGIADRSCYDLNCHSKETKTNFYAYEKYPEPKMVRELERKVEKGLVNKTFKRDAAPVLEYLNTLPEEAALELEKKLAEGDVEVEVKDGMKVTLVRKMASFAMVDKKVDGYNYTPSVIEPSFGVGRILYTLLEQCYWVRRDEAAAAAEAAKDDKKKKADKKKGADNEKRAVFSLPTRLAPYKVAIMPLSPSVYREEYCLEVIRILRERFSRAGVSSKIDEGSQSIGRKYARADEIGVPYDITIDPDYPTSGNLTLRERDSTKQVFVKIDEVVKVLTDLCNEAMTWADVLEQYPVKQD